MSDVYAQLTAEGWLEARVGSGTWVADSTPAGGWIDVMETTIATADFFAAKLSYETDPADLAERAPALP